MSVAYLTKNEANKIKEGGVIFLQQSLTNAESFAAAGDSDKATHFIENGGPITPISKLITKDKLDVNVLDLPTMDFTVRHEEHQTELKIHKTGETKDEEEVLDVPKY